MNFLMRSTTNVYGERSPIPEPRVDVHQRSASAGSSLESRVSDDPYAKVDRGMNGLNSKHDLPTVVDKHLDVAEDEGWITIPCSMSSLHPSFFSCLLQFLLILLLNLQRILDMIMEFGRDRLISVRDGTVLLFIPLCLCLIMIVGGEWEERVVLLHVT